MDKIMTCSCYVNGRCSDGSCPRALYFEYGADFGFELITCEECYCAVGSCDTCILEYFYVCPLSYVLAEARPVWRMKWEADI